MEKKTPEQDNSTMNTMAMNQRLDQLIEINTEILDSAQKAEGHLSTIKILIILTMVFGVIAVLVSCSSLF